MFARSWWKRKGKEAADAPAPALSLALQGGGAHGAYTWGVLDRLLEDDWRLDGISGTSAGAMNAVALADGWVRGGAEGARESLAGFWEAVADSTPFELDLLHSLNGLGGLGGGADGSLPAPVNLMLGLTRLFSPYQLNPFDLNPLRDVVEKRFDFERIRSQCRLRLFIAATQVRTGKVRLFHTHEISADALLASACLPTLHHAVEIDGEAYWDGGFTANPAVYPLIYDCTTPDILLVLLNPLRHPEARPRTDDQPQVVDIGVEALDRLGEKADLIAGIETAVGFPFNVDGQLPVAPVDAEPARVERVQRQPRGQQIGVGEAIKAGLAQGDAIAGAFRSPARGGGVCQRRGRIGAPGVDPVRIDDHLPQQVAELARIGRARPVTGRQPHPRALLGGRLVGYRRCAVVRCARGAKAHVQPHLPDVTQLARRGAILEGGHRQTRHPEIAHITGIFQGRRLGRQQARGRIGRGVERKGLSGTIRRRLAIRRRPDRLIGNQGRRRINRVRELLRLLGKHLRLQVERDIRRHGQQHAVHRQGRLPRWPRSIEAVHSEPDVGRRIRPRHLFRPVCGNVEDQFHAGCVGGKDPQRRPSGGRGRSIGQGRVRRQEQCAAAQHQRQCPTPHHRRR